MTAWGWIGWALAIFFGDLLAVAVIVALFASRRVADAERRAHAERTRRLLAEQLAQFHHRSAEFYRKDADLMAHMAGKKWWMEETS